MDPWAAAHATERSEAAMIARITYWIRKASPALTNATPKRTAKTARSTTRAGWFGKIQSQPSRNPKM